MAVLHRLAARPRLIAAVLLMALVGALGAAVTLSADVARLDSLAVAGLHAASFRPALDAAVLAVTEAGGNHALLYGTLLAVAALAAVRRWHGALAVAIAVPATSAVVYVVKQLVERPRPDADVAVAHAPGFSFPSGHSAGTMALYATIGFVLARGCRGPARTAIVAAAALIVLAVGASRVYLGAHYPTDVLAGWLTGAVLTIAAWGLAGRLSLLPGPARRSPG